MPRTNKKTGLSQQKLNVPCSNSHLPVGRNSIGLKKKIHLQDVVHYFFLWLCGRLQEINSKWHSLISQGSYGFLICESGIHGPTSSSLSDIVYIFLVVVRCEIFNFFRSWSGPFCEWSRIYFIELNTFFGKHYFRYPAKHWLCWGRMLFMGPVSAPAIKQYYSYATDTRCKRLGNHAWVS